MTAGTKKRPDQQQLAGREVNPSAKGRMTMTSIAQNTDIRVYTEPAEGEERPLPHIAWSGREWRLWYQDENGEVDERLLAGGIKDARFAVQQATAHLATIPTPDIAKLLEEIDAVPAGHYLTLGEDHPLYEAPGTRKVYADSRLRNPARIHEALAANGVDGTHTFGTIYRLDGSEVPVSERVDGWWEQQEALTANTGALHATLDTFNAAARLGEEFVIVGRGRWFAVAEVDVDGEPGIEFVEWTAYTDDYYAKLNADRDEWLTAHPEIRDLGPSWAENIDVSPEEDGKRVVTYERDYDGGNRYVEATYDVATGDLKFATGQFVAYDYRGDLAGLEKFSADLARMVETIKTEGA